MPIRCKYFDESGNPRSGGCHSKNCGYIHPGNPAWERALIPRNTPRDLGRGGLQGHSIRTAFGQEESRGRGRGRGSNSTSGWATGANAADNSGFETGNAKDSAKASDTGRGSAGGGWGDSSSGTWGSTGWGDSGTGSKKSSGGGWGDSSLGTWGSAGWGDSGTGSKESSGGGWGDSSDTWGSTGWGDSGTGSKESSGGGWGNSPSGALGSTGWGESGTGSKESGSGRGTSGEVAQPVQEKRDTQEKEMFKSPTVPPPRPAWGSSSGWDERETKAESRPVKMTGTNQVPMVNTKWNRRETTTTSLNPGPHETPRISPLQTSALGNWTPGQSSALPSASRSEGDHMDVEKPLQTMPVKSRSRSPSVSTVAASTANRKRKFGDSDLEKQQEYWRDFIRLFDRAIRAKAGFDKAEAERQSWVRTQKSTTYERIGDAGRNRLDGHRTALEAARKSHSEKLTRAIYELAEAGETLKSGIDYDQRYDIEDQVTRYVKEVGAWLEDIRSLLIANTSQHPPNPDVPTIDEDNMPEEIRPNPDGLDPLRSRLDKQEELLEELRTALTLESSKDVLATINSRIDQKINSLREARAGAKELLAKVPPAKVDIPSEVMGTIEDVSRRASELSMAMEKPVNDVARLLIHQDEMKKTYASFKTENEELKESMAKLAEMSVANRELIQAQTETIQCLKASLESVSELQRTPPPAEPAVKVMFQDLRAAVDNVVQDILLREVVPAIMQMSEACRSENQSIHREVFETIWDRVEPALKLTEAVNHWVTRFDLPAS